MDIKDRGLSAGGVEASGNHDDPSKNISPQTSGTLAAPQAENTTHPAFSANSAPVPIAPGVAECADGSILVAEWALNFRMSERVRVRLERYRGTWLVDVRRWFETEGGEVRPTKAGIAFGVKHLPKFADAIATALAEARKRGLVPPIDGGGS
jgi:hypothetical protein